jgi:hypothetical protein
MTYTHTCNFCEETFQGKRSAARYCSDACRAAAWRERRSRAARTRSGASGLQVSARKMEKVIERRLVECGYSRFIARQRAFEDVRAAMSARQRERFIGGPSVVATWLVPDGPLPQQEEAA